MATRNIFKTTNNSRKDNKTAERIFMLTNWAAVDEFTKCVDWACNFPPTLHFVQRFANNSFLMVHSFWGLYDTPLPLFLCSRTAGNKINRATKPPKKQWWQENQRVEWEAQRKKWKMYRVNRSWEEGLEKNRGEQMDSTLSIIPAAMWCSATSQMPYLFQA